jgi:hypothetical protein
MAFNAFVAGAGVGELLRMAIGFAGAQPPPLQLAFSFTEGTGRRNGLPGTLMFFSAPAYAAPTITGKRRCWPRPHERLATSSCGVDDLA